MSDPAATAADALVRAHWARAVAAVAAAVRDLDAAEEAVQDALATAVDRWPRDGVPRDPLAWLVAVARNRARDALRRRAAAGRVLPELAVVSPSSAPPAWAEAGGDADDEADVPDERLRLIFTCCHPALSTEAQVCLTLRLVAGLEVPEIARATLSEEPAVRQRLVRAKGKIRDAAIPFRVPPAHLLPERLTAVAAVVALVYTEGHTATRGDDLIRGRLCEEAIRLAEALVELMPDEPEAAGLLGMLLLHDARRPARTDGGGRPVLLADQDRTRWDAGRIARGTTVLDAALRHGRPGPYQLQAAIAAVHAQAPRAADTDWPQIAALYRRLLTMTPTPVVALNHAVAVAEAEGPDRGLALMAPLAGPLDGYVPFHAARAELLRRAGDADGAWSAYDRAIALSANGAERAHLVARRGSAGAPASSSGRA